MLVEGVGVPVEGVGMLVEGVSVPVKRVGPCTLHLVASRALMTQPIIGLRHLPLTPPSSNC